MRKYFFNWTPDDVAAWEKIRAKGIPHFIGWYGLQLFGGGLFVLLGGIALLLWIKTTLETHVANLVGLALQLFFIAAACLLGGIVAALLTGTMEEGIYQKMLKRRGETEAGKAKQ